MLTLSLAQLSAHCRMPHLSRAQQWSTIFTSACVKAMHCKHSSKWPKNTPGLSQASINLCTWIGSYSPCRFAFYWLDVRVVLSPGWPAVPVCPRPSWFQNWKSHIPGNFLVPDKRGHWGHPTSQSNPSPRNSPMHQMLRLWRSFYEWSGGISLWSWFFLSNCVFNQTS